MSHLANMASKYAGDLDIIRITASLEVQLWEYSEIDAQER